MIARDVMTRDVVSVTSDTPVRKIASLLVKNRISAVPVVNSSGAPIGIVSEGDLIGRKEAECEEREVWWLTLLAGGEELSSDFLTSLNYPTAHDLMSALVITVGEETRPHRGGGGKREKAISQGHGGAGEEIVNAHLSLGLEIIPIVHRNYDGWTIRCSSPPDTGPRVRIRFPPA